MSLSAPMNPALVASFAPPVMEARGWLEGVAFAPDRPLLNLSQAAPVDPPPAPLRAAMAEAMEDAQTHLYGPVLGMPELREALAARTAAIYGGAVSVGQVAITSGCNQAFCAAIATLAGAGDAVMVPVPWYFNHKMWLDMNGIETVPLPCGADLLPDPATAASRITPRTRAIVLVSPNNPAGVEYPPALLEAFRDLARARGIALILDETYRDFHALEGAPHGLFADPDWDDVLIHLYSFSKAYRLTGHRVGAMLASPARLEQAEKFLDSVAICPTGLGQRAALWGIHHLDGWLAGERDEILARRAALQAGFQRLPGWAVESCGAYFAWVRHPFDLASDALARRLVREAALLLLPGTMFMPSPADGAAHLRIAFANADAAGIDVLVERLAALKL
ncbi:aminotransferase [Rhodobacteraceae bacterium 2376]|uniref:aspartate transaminase n=2 Tax=Rhabdonatronobacter sediminivivens TaxID=2743469 RepID=A0A7Z0HXK5_9RHOB|nr:aminotransferase [Rhabdonatronobacter sediminivivens]